MAFDTAKNIINDAAIELGIVSAALPDPFASADQNFAQLAVLLKRLGREIERKREWTHLQREYTFTTVTNQSTYPLPADCRNILNQTMWNRTNRLPIAVLSPQDWQQLKAQLAGVVFTVLFRPEQGKIYLFPDTNTPGGYLLAFEYVTSFWVQPVGQTAPSADAPSASTDTICFDPLLMVTGLELAWLKAKGFDTSAAQGDFDDALNAVMSEDGNASVLSLNGGGRGVPLIGPNNLPITGYGH